MNTSPEMLATGGRLSNRVAHIMRSANVNSPMRQTGVAQTRTTRGTIAAPPRREPSRAQALAIPVWG